MKNQNLFLAVIALAILVLFSGYMLKRAPVTSSNTNATANNNKEIPTASFPVTFEESGGLFTWKLFDKKTATSTVVIYTKSSEMNVYQNIAVCNAENMFDAPTKVVKDMLFPIMHCTENNGNNVYLLAFKSIDGILVNKLETLEKCSDVTLCDMTKMINIAKIK